MSFTVVKDSYPNIVKDGLVLNVDAGSRLSYSGSGTTWSDISGSGNNGTLQNGPTYSSANSGSIVFDGTNDYVDLGAFFTYQTFTISIWVYPGATQNQYADIFDNNHTGNRNFVLQQNNLTTNQYSFGVSDASGGISGSDLINLTANVWTHLSFTFSPTSRVIAYVNGTFHSQGALAGGRNILYQSQFLRLCAWGGGARIWNGRISNFSVYTRALSAAEILQNYNALLPRYYSIVTSGLVLNLDAGNPNSYSPPRSDQYASSLVLAVPMNGANNGTTFTDESATIRGSGTAKTITRVGDTKTLTAQSKFYGSSGFFDGTGDYLETSTSDDFIVGTGNFTLEGWFNVNASQKVNARLFGQNVNNSSNWDCYINGTSGTNGIFMHGGNTNLQMSFPSAGNWHHFCIVRSNNVLYSFMNGELKNTQSYTNSVGVSNFGFRIGNGGPNVGSGYTLNGYLQDLRIYKGVAKYTTNFKPPSISSGVTISSASGGVPILNTTDDYGTVNGSSGTTWTDISGNGNTGTLVNGPTYNGANYGSIVFDGGDDYVSVPNSSSFNFGSGDLTVEAIVYLTAYPSNWNGYYTGMIAQQDHNVERSWYFFLGGTSTSWTSLNFGNFTTTVTSTQTFSLNTWYHLVASKIGTSTRLYVNGIDAGVSANVGAIPTTSQNITIGHQDPVWSSFGYSYSLPARLPVIRIYKGKGLTAAEVSQNFNALKWRYGI